MRDLLESGKTYCPFCRKNHLLTELQMKTYARVNVFICPSTDHILACELKNGMIIDTMELPKDYDFSR